MPARAKRPCRHKGCAAITNDASGYCDQHRQQHVGDGWRNYQAGKEQISSIVQEMLVSQHFQDCRGSELTHPSPSGQPTLYCAISSRLFSITTFSFICRCRSWILKPCITTACTIAASSCFRNAAFTGIS